MGCSSAKGVEVPRSRTYAKEGSATSAGSSKTPEGSKQADLAKPSADVDEGLQPETGLRVARLAGTEPSPDSPPLGTFDLPPVQTVDGRLNVFHQSAPTKTLLVKDASPKRAFLGSRFSASTSSPETLSPTLSPTSAGPSQNTSHASTALPSVEAVTEDEPNVMAMLWREETVHSIESCGSLESSGCRFRIQSYLAAYWMDIDAEDARRILEQLVSGNLKFEMMFGKHWHEVDFNDMDCATQTNLATGEARSLRLVTLDGDRVLPPKELNKWRRSMEDSAHCPQSLRGNPSLLPLSALSAVSHGHVCFSNFLKNEERMRDRYAVFYHCYSSAALLYEVQAALAHILFGFRSQHATLPRVRLEDFKDFPDASKLANVFTTQLATGKRDHDPRYRAVAISGMCSLLALGPECCITQAFVDGYSCEDVDLRGCLEKLLESFYIPEGKLKPLMGQIVALAERYSLDVSPYGGAACYSGRPGHLLQIFIKRKLVDKLVYAAKPYGAVDDERMPLAKHMDSQVSFAQGQVRILAHPTYFLRKDDVRLFVTSAEGNFMCCRQRFQEQLVQILRASLQESAATIRGDSMGCVRCPNTTVQFLPGSNFVQSKRN
eukprot:TRINITY_DN47248_c0_g1_i1.p1 TRINITY_DN47248_c0_g1~~TRINITY_DN47248_c0_g1_i1.p1  ORF type:complete len:605 (-),score=76.40 TRINITY_DN47248_c0_g1_i1:267-2081(-)